ncbi:molybdenum ABC transporter ATP-binding protein [Marinobacter halodurans]|uniref:Molybdenum ABC transporter ATP-binding protein n=1 Tax=Marinobacter halodurans TaxID=2528979 RepID=A0ABY1ZGX0_9GAMM|nr:molybdenum ABC transporter ATP-binding protein [Marinobacter halodurans]TBW51868.1 molybdenum ABC transporter ATP-binding protein [Marinobacter halodurans]
MTDRQPKDAGLRLQLDHRPGDFHLQTALDLPAHGVTALFGASGSGKTSLLRLIAGLDRPDSGTLHIGGDCLVDTGNRTFVPPHKRRLGVVFQEARLFPHYRVRGNLTYGMPRPDPERFASIVSLLGIDHLLDRFPATLSGGEARRVAIGRALLSEPRMLLMDEPLTGLDGPRKQELLHFILRLTREIAIPILYVSHDPEELTAIADHLVLMHEGRVLASGPLDDLLMRFDLTAELGGFDAASVIEAEVVGQDVNYGLTLLTLNDGQHLTIPAVDAAVGERLRLRIPVRDVALALAPHSGSSYRNQLQATITDTAVLPDNPTAIEVRLQLGNQSLRARLTRKSFEELALDAGQEVTVLVKTVAFALRR